MAFQEREPQTPWKRVFQGRTNPPSPCRTCHQRGSQQPEGHPGGSWASQDVSPPACGCIPTGMHEMEFVCLQCDSHMSCSGIPASPAFQASPTSQNQPSTALGQAHPKFPSQNPIPAWPQCCHGAGTGSSQMEEALERSSPAWSTVKPSH